MPAKKTSPSASLPEKVRNSRLIKALDKAASDDATSGFDYIPRLADLAKTISPQLEWIPHLFPEYTPHGFESHVVRLFRIADEILGQNCYKKLNSMELFLLAAGIFGHDWGMAVGGAEQLALKKGAKCNEQTEGYILLKDENRRLVDFALERGLNIESDSSIPELVGSELAEYVRRTHAHRSSARIYRELKQFDSSVADAAAFICEAHWLDLKDIRRQHEERPADIIFNSEVPLSAISIYVRLIDLLDLARDRTPPKLEAFVGSSNSKSKIEWEKHRTLSPVKGRQVGQRMQLTFQGTVKDPRIWAALRDQARWVDAQFESGLSFLSHYTPDHQLTNIESHIKWEFKPSGFKPANIRFEFNRKRVFQILGNELYGENHCVFIRELLQNAIDATRIRKPFQHQYQPESKYSPKIVFKVIHQKNGDATISCTDNGIGMDEYVVSNYLAAVGESYSESADFRRLGIKADLIARYGIGFLSCFTVADVVEIRTRRYAPPGKSSDALKIIIDEVDKEFSIYDENDFLEFGTEIVVHVLCNKIRSVRNLKSTSPNPKLRIAEYLVRLAGFVEAEIEVIEDGKTTLLLHPQHESSTGFEKKCDVIQYGPKSIYSLWKDFTIRSQAGRLLSLNHVSIKDKLSITSAEGDVYYTTLPEGKYGWVCKTDSDDFGQYEIIDRKSTLSVGAAKWPDVFDDEDFFIRNYSTKSTGDTDDDDYFSYRTRRRRRPEMLYPPTENEKSPQQTNLSRLTRSSLFLDGINVPESHLDLAPLGVLEESPYSDAEPTGTLFYHINIKPCADIRVVAARDRFLDDPNQVSKEISKAFIEKVISPRLKDIISRDPYDRMLGLARLITDFGLDIDWLSRVVGLDECPIPVFNDKTGFQVISGKDIGDRILWLTPTPMSRVFCSPVLAQWAPSWFRSQIVQWSGPTPLAITSDEAPSEINLAISLSTQIIRRNLCFETLRLIEPPKSSQPPLLVLGYKKYKLEEFNSTDVAKKGMENPQALSQSELRFVAKKLRTIPTAEYMLLNTCKWPTKSNYAAFAQLSYNLAHPAIEWFIRCASFLALDDESQASQKNSLFAIFSKVDLDEVISDKERRADLDKNWRSLGQAAAAIPWLNKFTQPPLPLFGEYVPKTVRNDSLGFEFIDMKTEYRNERFRLKIGKPASI